jgi:aarF domain-containing kinase
MLEHRLSPPPEEIYSLHRKLSGSFLLAAKLQASVPCGTLFREISEKYEYGEVNDGTTEIFID